MTYDDTQIAAELYATAIGDAYYSNALYVVRDHPALDAADRRVLNRWLEGRNWHGDGPALQEIAMKVRYTFIAVGARVLWHDPDPASLGVVRPGRVVRADVPVESDSVVALAMDDGGEVEAYPCELRRALTPRAAVE